MNSPSNRIHFIDLMRGFAVVLMILGHTVDAVLSQEARSREWFQIYTFFRGFTAPVFLFVSGIAFSVATEKRWSEYTAWSPPLRSRIRRIFLLFSIGYALHLPFFSFDKLLTGASETELARFYQADVLHCVAACLLLLHSLILLTRKPEMFVKVIIALGIIVAAATPLVWATDLSPRFSVVFSPYLNQRQLSLFPLFPYAAFLLSGVATGHYFRLARERGDEKLYFTRLLMAGALLACAGVLLDLLPVAMYPSHDFWKTSPNFFIIRTGVLILLTVGFYSLRSVPSQVRKQLTTLGQSSLLVYTLHIVIVYGSAIGGGLAQHVGPTLTAPTAFACGAILLLVMLAAVHGWNHLSLYKSPARFTQIALTGTFLFLFLIRSY